MKLSATLLAEPRDDNVPLITAPVEVIDVAVPVATVGAVAVGGVTTVEEALAALNVHQPGVLLRESVRHPFAVDRFGKISWWSQHTRPVVRR